MDKSRGYGGQEVVPAGGQTEARSRHTRESIQTMSRAAGALTMRRGTLSGTAKRLSPKDERRSVTREMLLRDAVCGVGRVTPGVWNFHVADAAPHRDRWRLICSEV